MIALLIMGSFVPWLYYSFYCSLQPRLIYLSIVCVSWASPALIVAQWTGFATPQAPQTRAGGPKAGRPRCLDREPKGPALGPHPDPDL